jgi:hypothetical protein
VTPRHFQIKVSKSSNIFEAASADFVLLCHKANKRGIWIIQRMFWDSKGSPSPTAARPFVYDACCLFLSKHDQTF